MCQNLWLMDDRLRAIEMAHGVFLRREILEHGYDDEAIGRALRLKLWWRVRHGAYCSYDTWAGADELERHLIRARAVLRQQRGKVALSHVSSLIAQRVAVWNVDLSRVHITRLDGGVGRTTRDVVHHASRLRDTDVREAGGILMTRPAQAAMEAATVNPLESALVSADSALHQGLATPDELEDAYRRMEGWPGSRPLRLVAALADGRAESPGETRTLHLCWKHGLPRPEQQFSVYDEDGTLIGITDFAWPQHGVLGEFDGRQKYGRLLRPDQDPADVVFAEKRREDRLREVTGWSMIRIVWSDLQTPVATAGRIARMLRSAA